MKGYARDRVIWLSVFISRYGDLYLVYPFFIYFIFDDMNDVSEWKALVSIIWTINQWLESDVFVHICKTNPPPPHALARKKQKDIADENNEN